MNIAALYEDDRFNDTLVYLAQMKNLRDFDDFRQSVFFEILDSGSGTYRECLKAANRVAKLYGRNEYGDDIMNYAYENDSGDFETDDEVMSRMIHEGRAVKVG